MNLKDIQTLEFGKNNPKFAEVLNKAKGNKSFKELVEQRKQQGYTVDEEQTYVKQYDFKDGNEDVTIYVASHNILKDGKEVGEVTFLSHPKEESAYSNVALANGKAEVKFEKDGKIEDQIFEQNEVGAFISNAQCRALVSAICSAGMGASIGSCVAGCVVMGPAQPVCSLICGALVAMGCFSGAGAVCAFVK
ncbi:hypothetical protein [Bacillus sp. Brlt_9]|uniref:hypothetical protein n=1 Tax=Bacillus sp. Brlt_9 TaxID=3110916 RepID=UPI003F7CA30F